MITRPRLEADVYESVGALARKFANEVIRPVAADLDREERFASEIFAQMSELGLFGITVPEALGGGGLDCLAYAVIMEELARGYASVADQCGLVELIGTLLSQHGTAEQQKRHLPDILKLRKMVAYCITEAGAGSDVAAIRTTARETNDGWRLSGSKLWINNAPIADLGFVLARTDPALGHRGMSIFIVDLKSPGVARGPKEHKMGQCGSQVGGLDFDEVSLPREALLGERNRGFHIMMSVLEKGRVGIGALATGIAQAGLEAALEYAQVRKQFGKSIAENQGVQWMLADMATEVSASRALVHQAAMRLDSGLPAAAACSMAKCFASDTAVRQTANAVQIFGGSGYIRGIEVERLYRDAKITQIYEGTNQIQRTVIGRDLVKNGIV